MSLDGTFDFIVIGAGSSGCVVANRLSQDGRHRVALIEAGGRDNWIWFHVPAGYLFAIGNPRADWLFRTEPEPGLNGRALNYPRGKVIGGCSAINAMIYMRGQAADYDAWRQMGLAGWGWDEVLPFFMKHEDHFAGATDLHGSGGEWRVEPPRMRWEILDAFREAAAESGIPAIEDFNRGNNEGCAYFQVNQRRGWRWSTARGFLKPALRRKNLSLVTHALVDRILVEEGRASAVLYRREGREHRIEARREIILCAGAVATPTILQRSGLGAAELLQRLGIPIVADLPGVGRNLQDHLQLRPIFKVFGTKTLNVEYRSLFKRARMGLDFALARRGPLTMAPSQLGAFTRSSAEFATPNLQFHVQPLSLDKFGEPMHDFPAITVSVCNLRPTSRGRIEARSSRPEDKPLIAPNYLSTEADGRVAVDAIRLVRKIMRAPALARFRPEEYRPGPQLTTEADLIRAAGDIGTTIFHPVGTAKMGTESDPQAVADAQLRVRGIAALRIADASVMPAITSGNTNSPTIMIAEKASAMILEDAR